MWPVLQFTCAQDPDSKVEVLTDATFRAEIARRDMMVEFYAPCTPIPIPPGAAQLLIAFFHFLSCRR
jgi:hypothetical protein